MRSAVLFDLDGTLVDSLADLARALNAVLAAEGLPPLPEATVRGLVGRGAARLVAEGFAAAGQPLDGAALEARLARFLSHYGAAPVAHSRAYPGVAATLSRLRSEGWQLGVCTNKPQHLSEAVLAGLGLAQFFAAVAGGDRFPVRKPDGGHLRATLDLMDATVGQAILVGDSDNDVKAAWDAGMPVVLVDYGYSRVPVAELGADRVVSDFRALPAVLGDIARQDQGLLQDVETRVG